MQRLARLQKTLSHGLRALPGLAAAAALVACSPAQEKPAPEAEAAAEAPGLWHELRSPGTARELSPDEVARLEAIGYAAGSEPAPTHRGVTRHDRDRAQQGPNFYTSGHAPEAFLVDMDGAVLHRWRRELLEVWPDYPREWLHAGAGYFRRAHLFENGDLLVIFEGIGLVKLDRNSNVLWARQNRAHHDLQVTPDGEIYVLTRRGHVIPRIDAERPVLEDFIAVLDADGIERQRVSLLDALERSRYRGLWSADARMKTGDLFHTNSLEVLDARLQERLPAFRAGNVLVSMLVPDLVAVVDLEREEVVWAVGASFAKQHDPKVLDNGNLLLFDNRGTLPHSRVLEFDPANPEELSWVYAGSDEAPFLSFSCGTAERLTNGNTLVTESDGGRAFEVTRDREIVWEFYSPHRAGEQDELIATLFEMIRLPRDFPIGWARSPQDR